MSETYTIEVYNGDTQLDALVGLMEVDLSEPYNVFTYRFFVDRWPDLTYLAFSTSEALAGVPDAADVAARAQTRHFYAPCRDGTWRRLVGGIVCKLDVARRTGLRRGYIAMLAVDGDYRRHGIGRAVTTRALDDMVARGADEITLETETTNTASLAFYERFGFVRARMMPNYYLYAGDAYKLVLALPTRPSSCQDGAEDNAGEEEEKAKEEEENAKGAEHKKASASQNTGIGNSGNSNGNSKKSKKGSKRKGRR